MIYVQLTDKAVRIVIRTGKKGVETITGRTAKMQDEDRYSER